MLAFEKTRDNLAVAVEEFSEAAQKLAAEREGNNPETEQMMNEEANKVRGTINRLIGILCDQTGLDFHKMYILAYHEHFKRTGFHPVAASHGEGTHLDAVEEAGQMDNLRETVEGMLVKPEFGRES